MTEQTVPGGGVGPLHEAASDAAAEAIRGQVNDATWYLKDAALEHPDAH